MPRWGLNCEKLPREVLDRGEVPKPGLECGELPMSELEVVSMEVGCSTGTTCGQAYDTKIGRRSNPDSWQ